MKSNLLTFVDELLFVFAKILKLQKNTLNSGFLLTKNFDIIRRDESCPKIKSIFGFGKIRVSKGQTDKKILVQKNGN